METTQLTNLLEKVPNGIYIAIGVCLCLALIKFAQQYQELKASTISVKDKHFEQLSSLLKDENLINKPGLLLEQAFERYFGFILSADEIHHLLKSKYQLIAIRDLKKSRGMFKFKNNEFVYNIKPPLDKKIKMHTITYWLASIIGSVLIFYTLHHLSLQNLIMSLIIIIFWCLHLNELYSYYAAKRIVNKEYGPDTAQ